MQNRSKKLFFEIVFSRWWVRLAMLLLSLTSTLCGIAGPFYQKTFLDLIGGGSEFSHFALPLPTSESPVLALIFSFFCLGLSLASYQLVVWLGTFESIHMQQVLSRKLYAHTLSLRTEALHGKPIGELVAIYTTDIPGATVLLEQSLPQGMSIFFPMVLGPLVLHQLFDIPWKILVPLLLGIFLLNLAMAFRQSRFFFKFKRLAADRVGYVNEWIQNIRTLRILGWVQAFEQNILHVRRIETANRISMLNNGQSMNAISSSMTFILNVTLVAIMTFALKAPLSSGTLMTLLWIVGIFMTRPFRQMPWFFTFVFDSWTSISRIAEILDLKNPNQSISRGLVHDSDLIARVQKQTRAPGASLCVKNLRLSMNNNTLLDGIDLDIRAGEFVAVVGEVGSGKSLLLQSLLGETSAQFSEYRVNDLSAKDLSTYELRSFYSFVPQEGFIISGTLRENVAFEYDVSPHIDPMVKACLKRSQFDLSIERLEHGLNTEIGERGVNLSGGQKQRVSLARVDFSRAPIVLLDDCLSALDVNTENALIHDLLAGAWKDRTRILVTHRLSVLAHVDRIYFLKDGHLIGQGSLESLLLDSEEFRLYTQSLEQNHQTSLAEVPQGELA